MLSIRSLNVQVLHGLPAGVAALVWALAAGSVALWWLHFPRHEQALDTPVAVTPAAPDGQDTAWVMRALGQTRAASVTPDVQRRFQLLGVIAAESGKGSALLMVDGQPAQAFVQGQTVVDDWRLQAVGREGVRLSAGPDGASMELSLPERP